MMVECKFCGKYENNMARTLNNEYIYNSCMLEHIIKKMEKRDMEVQKIMIGINRELEHLKKLFG